MKRLISTARKIYDRRKLAVHCTEILKQQPKQLLAAKKSAQEQFLQSILSKEDKCWSDFYKYVKSRKGNKEIIATINDCNGRIITDAKENANTFNSYYSTLFSNKDNILHLHSENTGDLFTTDNKTIRRRIKEIGNRKSVG